MAQFFTDFSSDTVGSVPANWTVRSGSAGEHTIDTGQTGFGARYLKIDHDANWHTRFITWDEIGSVADIEVVMRASFLVNSDDYTVDIGVRATTNAENTGYFGQYKLTSGAGALDTYRNVSGTFTQMGTAPVSAGGAGSIHWVRMRVVGSDFYMRAWADGASEPATWDVTQAATHITAAGVMGLASIWANATMLIDLVGVGTDGDTAPTEAPSTSEPLDTPTNLTFVSQSGERTLVASWDAVTEAYAYEWELEIQSTVDSSWSAFLLGEESTTTVTFTEADGIDWGRTYRIRVRAIPEP